LLKLGATATASTPAPLSSLGVSALASGWTWVAIVCFIVSFVTWLQVLRRMPLHIAFSLTTIEYVLVPTCAWLFLGETVSFSRWCGILLIVAGVVVIAKPATKAEERL
jgi:multidrug transporter EmrE-like cation transporter